MAAAAHPFDASGGGDAARASQFRTLIHGDPKAANLFIRPAGSDPIAGSDPAGSGEAVEVGLIDFQWTGFGLAATDVAHHLCAAVSTDALEGDGERRLLDHYHAELCAALAVEGVAGSATEAAERVIPRQLLQSQYETAVLDMCRLVFSYQWSRFKESSSADSLNRNSYNKDMRNAVWLVARGDELLRARGVTDMESSRG